MHCELDASSDHTKTKIANAEQMKVHPANAGLVIGNRAKARNEVIADIFQSIKERRA